MIGRTIAEIKQECLEQQSAAKSMREGLISNIKYFLEKFDKFRLEDFPVGLSPNIDKLLNSLKTQYHYRAALFAIETQYENILLPTLASHDQFKTISKASLDHYRAQAQQYIAARTKKNSLEKFKLTDAVKRQEQIMEGIQKPIFDSGHQLNIALYQKEILGAERELIAKKTNSFTTNLSQLNYALSKLSPVLLNETDGEVLEEFEADFDFSAQPGEIELKICSVDHGHLSNDDPFADFSSDNSDSTNDPFNDYLSDESDNTVDPFDAFSDDDKQLDKVFSQVTVSAAFTPGYQGCSSSESTVQQPQRASCETRKYKN